MSDEAERMTDFAAWILPEFHTPRRRASDQKEG